LKKQVNGSFTPLQSQWKTKYVELRYGTFSYEDESTSGINMNMAWPITTDGAGNSSSSNNSTTSSASSGVNSSGGSGNTNTSNKKFIHLFKDSCQCRPFQIRGQQGNCSFELTIYGGQRRVWMAPSESERDAWVQSIVLAMQGCLGDVLKGANNSYSNEVEEAMRLNCRIPHPSDGPAAAFAIDIAKYVTIQSILHSVSARVPYRNILQQMHEQEVEVAIPVFYVKVSLNQILKFLSSIQLHIF
jgi:hypothetical protein